MGVADTTNLVLDAVVTENGPWTATPSGTVLGNLSDADTATGIQSPVGVGGHSIRFGVPTHTLGTGRAILGVEVFGTVGFSTIVPGQTITARLLLDGVALTGQTWSFTSASGNLSSGRYALSPTSRPLQYKNDGTGFLAADIGNLEVEVTVTNIGGGTTFRSRVWMLGVRVYSSTQPSAPTIVSPTHGSTVTSDTPTVVVNVPAHPQDGQDSVLPGLTQWIEHQFATNSLFTANLRTVNAGAPPAGVTNPDSAYSHVAVVPDAQALVGASQWYIRVRTVDNFGSYSPWTGAVTSFTISHPPSAINLSPAAGDIVVAAYNDPIPLSWDFADTSSTDNQTAYEVILERASTGADLVWTGKVVSTDTHKIVYVDDIDHGIELRWKVRLWDSRDDDGAFSTNTIFTVYDPPTLTIASPTAAGTVITPLPTVTGTFTSPAGQAIQRVRLVVARDSDGFVAYDSGFVVQPDAAATVAEPLEVATGYTATMYVIDSGGWQSSASVSFTTSWTLPATVPFVVDDDRHATHGYIELLWAGTVADPTWQAWRIYRRAQGAPTWTLLAESLSLGDSVTYQDWMAASNVAYEYAVVQVGLVDGAAVESARVAQDGLGLSDAYWLLHPTDELLTYRLHHVTQDTYTDEYESETINLIDVGRHTDLGTHLGVTGTLTAQIYDFDGASARDLQLALRRLKEDRSTLYLRTPFGDIWQVSAGNVQTDRVAGVGLNEYVTITLPYTEVA